MEKFTYFWQQQSPFSQWHLANFTVNGVTFNCCEQWMMYQKAILFQDQEAAQKILNETSPKQQKALGRKVKNFDNETWNAKCKDIVYEGNYHKFIQNESLLQALLKTKGTTLVEASPFDTIWGIGLKKEDPRARYRASWLGTNWLGEILTKLRDNLIEK